MSSKSAKKRTIAYPTVTLEHAVNCATELSKRLAKGPYTRNDAAHVLGCSESSGIVAAKMAACIHFGIMSNNGNGYYLSPLGERLVASDNHDRSRDLMQAIQSPVLYSKILGDFNGQKLPKNFEKVLVLSYEIGESVSYRAARNFIKSTEYAGVLKRGRINLELPQIPSIKPEAKTSLAHIAKEPSHAKSELASVSEGVDEVIKLCLPGTDVVVIFPKKYAYDLSVGEFSEGIKTLREDVMKAINRQEGGKM